MNMGSGVLKHIASAVTKCEPPKHYADKVEAGYARCECGRIVIDFREPFKSPLR